MTKIFGSLTASPTTTGGSIAAAILTALLILSGVLYAFRPPSKNGQYLRRILPGNLITWRRPGNDVEAEERIWLALDRIFRDSGYSLWPHAFYSVLKSPGLTLPLPSGFGYAASARSLMAPNSVGSVGRLRQFEYTNPLSRAARTRDGHDVIIRVIALGNEGREHLNILRRIAVGEKSLFNRNHTLPMFAEFEFEDIVFGVFPKAGGEVLLAYGSWARNSVGDVVEILVQMLEALEFIHGMNIAHRDAFRDNFLIQWHPESLLDKKISHPRVFLIDFETAIAFPPHFSADECDVTGYPIDGSFPPPEIYSRPHAPEFTSQKPYSPFKLDAWQVGKSFSDFKSTVPEIDEILAAMTNTDTELRLGPTEVLARLREVVYSVPQKSLLIEPLVLSDN